MRLLICRLCEEGEPFACPFKFRRTYMFMHLEKSHGLKPAEMAFMKTDPPAPGGPTLWMAGRGRDARPALDEVEIAMPGLASSRRGEEAAIPGARERLSAQAADRIAERSRESAINSAQQARYPDSHGGTSATYGPMH